MEIQGTIVAVLEPQVFNGRNGEFKKYGFILETQGQYPKKIHMQVYGEDKWSGMPIQQGQVVNVAFDVSSKEWNGKWFTQCDCWKVSLSQTQQQVAQPQVMPQQPQQSQVPVQQAPVDDTLPF